MTIEKFKQVFLWYVEEIASDKGAKGAIGEAVAYFNGLDDNAKATFIVEAYTLSEKCITMYHVVVGTYNMMKERSVNV